ncbi:MAG TPA: hypothetical protein VJI71_00480, partial [Candidatus Norongarragalinales archaeon]|nr:hypothetical protein [Candidatus Norongarragalinales archaeon]
MKTLVCDSSSLISLSESCNLGVLSFLKQKFGVDFVIPPFVQKEIVERPSRVGKFAFSAARLKHLLTERTLRVASVPSLSFETRKILSTANSLFYHQKPLTILQQGEAECLALLKPLNAKALVIDEKTTRLLVEDPQKLFSIMLSEHDAVKATEQNLGFFKKEFPYPNLRSTELLAFAAENGFFESYGSDENDIFHSAVYALRYSG